MAVMTFVADVLAGVVQEGGEVEPLAGPVVEPVRRARFVEDPERQARDLRGVIGRAVVSQGQLDHAPPPDVRVALEALDADQVAADVVEHGALAQRELAQRELVRAELAEDRVEEHGAGHNQIGAPGVEARQLEAVREAHRGNLAADVPDGLRADATVVNRDVARHLQRERPERERSAGRADDARVAGPGDPAGIVAELVADVAHHAALVAARKRVALHEALAEPDDAQPEALRLLDPGRGAEGDLRAAAADVDDHRRPGPDVDAVHRRPVDERGLFDPRDDAGLNPGLLGDRRQEVAPVGRLPDRAGGHGHDVVHLARIGQALEPGERLQRGRHGALAERAAFEAPGPEAHHVLLAADHLEGAVRRDADENHVERIRADVDGRKVHRRGISIPASPQA